MMALIKRSILRLSFIIGVTCILSLSLESSFAGDPKGKPLTNSQSNLLAKCVAGQRALDQVIDRSPAATRGRIDKLNQYFASLYDAPCVVISIGDGRVVKNPYKGIHFLNVLPGTKTSVLPKRFPNLVSNLGNQIFLLFQLAYTYDPNDKTPMCSDGWKSPSIGTQGACSYHGGVIQFRWLYHPSIADLLVAYVAKHPSSVYFTITRPDLF